MPHFGLGILDKMGAMPKFRSMDSENFTLWDDSLWNGRFSGQIEQITLTFEEKIWMCELINIKGIAASQISQRDSIKRKYLVNLAISLSRGCESHSGLDL